MAFRSGACAGAFVWRVIEGEDDPPRSLWAGCSSDSEVYPAQNDGSQHVRNESRARDDFRSVRDAPRRFTLLLADQTTLVKCKRVALSSTDASRPKQGSRASEAGANGPASAPGASRRTRARPPSCPRRRSRPRAARSARASTSGSSSPSARSSSRITRLLPWTESGALPASSLAQSSAASSRSEPITTSLTRPQSSARRAGMLRPSRNSSRVRATPTMSMKRRSPVCE